MSFRAFRAFRVGTGASSGQRSCDLNKIEPQGANSEVVEQHSLWSRSAPQVVCPNQPTQTLKGFNNSSLSNTFGVHP